jgi:hypothetical protein
MTQVIGAETGSPRFLISFLLFLIGVFGFPLFFV